VEAEGEGTVTSVAIVSACRSPFGRFGGSLRDLTAVDLGATAAREAIARAGLAPGAVQEAILGNCMGAASLGQVPGRQVALRSGLSPATLVSDVNTACTSALVAVELAFDRIRHAQAGAILAGGFESMSQVPYTLPGARFGYRLGNAPVVDALTAALICPMTGVHMGVYASRGALERGVDRAEQDLWAERSQLRYEAARRAGYLADEIVPVIIPASKGAVTVAADEQPRPDTTYAKLAALPPAFEPLGTVTAGNAPGLNDGAAALVLAAEPIARDLGITPLALVRATGRASGPPQEINSVPARAAQTALETAGLSGAGIDLWEINEAFACVPLTAIGALLPDRKQRTPMAGGWEHFTCSASR
jgi:acetyl-CoA C-acetyltransferase